MPCKFIVQEYGSRIIITTGELVKKKKKATKCYQNKLKRSFPKSPKEALLLNGNTL